MLHDAHRTLAPSASSVSISTLVSIVIWREPAIWAPASGCIGCNSRLIAMRPGISVSAMRISLCLRSAGPTSATTDWEAFDVFSISNGSPSNVRTASARPWTRRRPAGERRWKVIRRTDPSLVLPRKRQVGLQRSSEYRRSLCRCTRRSSCEYFVHTERKTLFDRTFFTTYLRFAPGRSHDREIQREAANDVTTLPRRSTLARLHPALPVPGSFQRNQACIRSLHF